jgi:3-deoxy-D-manno-octulosonic-acid transferase
VVVLGPYRVLARVAHRLPFPSSVLSASLNGRRGASARWRTWAAGARGAAPLVWVHGASVGELKTIEPVIVRLRRALRDVQIILTHTSSSVASVAAPSGVDRRDFLPIDEPAHLEPVFAALRPALLVFSRGDLWPELVHQADTHHVPIAVVGGTVRPESRRLGGIGRWFMGPAHRAVTWLGAASAEDASRWMRAGVHADRVAVTGDPRHDQILERVPALGPGRAVESWARGAPVFVAGSTEPSDDAVLVEAIARLSRSDPPARALIVPHDASPHRVANVRAAFAARAIPVARWDDARAPLPDAPAVIVGAHGLLADLYLAASVAYVGGGFRERGLHATAEPAAVGIPVMVGDRWRGALDIGALLETGGAIALPRRHPGVALAETVGRLVRNDEERIRRGLAARGVLVGGAAARSVKALLRQLEATGGREDGST